MADEVERILKSVHDAPADWNLFFEGPVKKVNGKPDRIEDRAGVTSKLLRIHLGLKDPSRHANSRKWSFAVGRPDWYWTNAVIQELQSRQYNCFGEEKKEADQQIALWSAQQQLPTVVLGTDSDFLAFADGVAALVCPYESDCWVVEKQQVLDRLQLTPAQLCLFYAASGCDNVHRCGIRAVHALEVVKKLKSPADFAKFNWDLFRLSKEEADRLRKEVTAIWDQYGWNPKQKYPQVTPLQTETVEKFLKSTLLHFIFE